jgi:mRNA-degrading endonuclease RelE of RelBE toxin-antitoxin system
MTGSQKFLKVPTRNFERWLKKLFKRYKGSRDKQAFQVFIAQLTDSLCFNPRPSNSAFEPIPGKITLSRELEFRKLRFAMPNLRGASGEGRLMYLINSVQNSIVLVWIYTHEEFEGRPDEKSLTSVLQDAVNSSPEETDVSANAEEQAAYSENNDASNPI